MFTEARALWLHENYLWLEHHLPARSDGTRARLVTPTPQDFPIRPTRDHVFADALFQRTREFMGLLDWPCRLVPHIDGSAQQRESFRQAGLLGRFSGDTSAGGTFRPGEEVEITYSPSLLHDPVALVATFSHELCHYLLAAVAEEPPATWNELEPLTDLAAVHEGFGLFLANSAFAFDQWTDHASQGWQAQNRGYLNEAELGFALGVFATRHQIDPEQIGRHLKRNPAEVFWDSLDFIAELPGDQSR